MTHEDEADMETILDTAARITATERQADYGHPREDFERTAAMWSAILGVHVPADRVPLCMIALKISRHCHKPKRDNLVDIAGYARTIERLQESEVPGPGIDHESLLGLYETTIGTMPPDVRRLIDKYSSLLNEADAAKTQGGGTAEGNREDPPAAD